MEVEKTIEFILDMQVKFETNLAAHDVHMARIDRRLEGITKILKIGMRQMVKLGESQRRTDAKMGELADAQKATELKLQTFIDSLQKGRNGN